MSDAPAGGRLFVVSTPIGNMGDFSFRAVEVLRSVGTILAEDTRHSRHLLQRYEIATAVESYHEHNEARMTPAIVQRLQQGTDVALISDAGTPLLSDPGARLVKAVADAGLVVVPIPGASAMLAALVASAIDAERFTFFGFLPRKGKERSEALAAVATLPHTAILYEAPGRVAATLADLAALGAGERTVAVARELTKQFEEVRRGTVGQLAAYYEESPPRGEVVMVVAGAQIVAPTEEGLRAKAAELRASGASARDIVASLVGELGAPRNVAYRIAHE